MRVCAVDEGVNTYTAHPKPTIFPQDSMLNTARAGIHAVVLPRSAAPHAPSPPPAAAAATALVLRT